MPPTTSRRSPLTSQQSSRPAPYLPLELKQHILRFCDPSTLAITSRVSLAFLELSSPIHYQDIEIVGLKNVEKLFCFRDLEIDHPHLHPHLSFFHVRNLTIVATSDVGGGILNLSTSRFPPSSSSSLLIDLLTLRPIGIDSHVDVMAELERWSCIWPLPDPQRVHVLGLRNAASTRSASPSDRLPGHRLLPHPLASPSPSPPYKRHPRVSNSITSTRPFTLLFDLTSSLGDEDYTDDLMERATHECGLNRMVVKEYVVRVGSRIGKTDFQRFFVEFWSDRAVDVEERFERIRFEDSTATCCWRAASVLD